MESLLALEWLWQAWSAVSCSCPLLGGCQNLLQALREMVEALLNHSGCCWTQWALDCSLLINCVPRNAQVTNDASERLSFVK